MKIILCLSRNRANALSSISLKIFIMMIYWFRIFFSSLLYYWYYYSKFKYFVIYYTALFTKSHVILSMWYRKNYFGICLACKKNPINSFRRRLFRGCHYTFIILIFNIILNGLLFFFIHIEALLFSFLLPTSLISDRTFHVYHPYNLFHKISSCLLAAIINTITKCEAGWGFDRLRK